MGWSFGGVLARGDSWCQQRHRKSRHLGYSNIPGCYWPG